MINLVIFGNGKPIEMILNALENTGIHVLNVEQDKKLNESQQADFEKFVLSSNSTLNQFDKLNKEAIDLILTVNYNKIINTDNFSSIKLINLHMGLLPKYRGNSANAWAVLNGENVLGYTLHELTEMLDGGDIYYTYKYNIDKDLTYYSAKQAINEDIQANIANVISKIVSRKIRPKSQEGQEFIYCSKIRPSDGIITNWDVSSDILIRKSYVFGRPLGTGLKFNFKGTAFEIGSIKVISGFANSYGIPGGIVYIHQDYLWIKTRDTAVELRDISIDGESIQVKEWFKIGMRL